jgi:hypothetical protein
MGVCGCKRKIKLIMKLITNCILLFLFVTTASCQTKVRQPESSVKKWVLATVPLEGRYSNDGAYESLPPVTDSISWANRARWLDSVHQIHDGEQGSAIFFKYDSSLFLVSARHVFIDRTSRGGNRIFSNILLGQSFGSLGAHMHDSLMENGNVLVRKRDQPFLTTLSREEYILSDSADVGVICLSKSMNGRLFAETLRGRGYEPIEISNVDTTAKAGDKIMAIGFPIESLYGRIALPRAITNWESDRVYVPIVTTGTVHSFDKTLPYFYSDIFIYHGNSGGPIIKGNKLIGIVSQIDTTNNVLDPVKKIYYNEMKFRCMKISLILPLLAKLNATNKID